MPIAELRSEFGSMRNGSHSGTTWRRILLQDARFEVPKTGPSKSGPILGPLGGVYYFRMHVFEVPKTICPDVQNANTQQQQQQQTDRQTDIFRTRNSQREQACLAPKSSVTGSIIHDEFCRQIKASFAQICEIELQI